MFSKGFPSIRKPFPASFCGTKPDLAIFDAICNSEAYGLTRLEMSFLRECSNDVADIVGCDACIVEFGSGASRKVCILLDAMDRPKRYIAIDISRDFMGAAAARLTRDYSELRRRARLRRLFEAHSCFAHPPSMSRSRLLSRQHHWQHGAWPAVRLLRSMKAAVEPGWLLVSQDHNSDPKKLEAAYGGTLMASFHKNILVRMMQELGAKLQSKISNTRSAFSPVRRGLKLIWWPGKPLRSKLPPAELSSLPAKAFAPTSPGSTHRRSSRG